MEAFTSLGLSADFGPQLSENGIEIPTPIQAASIPIILTGRDLIGIAQTGTGKTLAFALPLIERLNNGLKRVLILAPTRELADQIGQSIRPYTGPSRIGTAILVGGKGMQLQTQDLRRQPKVVVATPGRMMDHVMKGNLRLREFDAVVLDEADRMLDMGFMPIIRQILAQTAGERQTMLFSATMPPMIEQLTKEFMKNPDRVEMSPQNVPVELIEQSVYIVKHDNKNALLDTVVHETTGPVLVFTRTRHGARKVCKYLCESDHRAVEIHADRTQAQRDAAMAGFRSGRFRVMVATDIAARGIDVKNIELVIQFDLPDCDEDYVHRIGRTGRAGADGKAVVFVTPEASKQLEGLERTIGFEIATSEDSPLPRPERKLRARGMRPARNNAPQRDSRELVTAGSRAPQDGPPVSKAVQDEIDERWLQRQMRAQSEANEGQENAWFMGERNENPNRREDRGHSNERGYNDRGGNRDGNRGGFQNRDNRGGGGFRGGNGGGNSGGGNGGNFGGNRGGNFGRDNRGPSERDQRPTENRYGNDRPNFGDRNNDRPNNDRPNNDRPNNDRPQNDRPQNDRPNYGDRPNNDRNNNDRPPFNRDQQGGDRPNYGRNNDRPAYGDRNNNERPPFNRDRQGGRPGGDRPNYGRNNDRPAYGDRNNDRPNYDRPNTDRPAYGDRNNSRPFNRNARPGDRPGFDRNNADRPAYGDRNNDRPNNDRPNNDRPNNDRPAFGNRGNDRPSYGRPNNDRPAFGDRKPFGNRDGGFKKPFGKKSSEGNFDKPKPSGDRGPAPVNSGGPFAKPKKKKANGGVPRNGFAPPKKAKRNKK